MTQRSYRELLESALWDYRFYKNTLKDFGPSGYDYTDSAKLGAFKNFFGVPSCYLVQRTIPAVAAYTEGTIEFLAHVGYNAYTNDGLTDKYYLLPIGDSNEWVVGFIEDTGKKLVVKFNAVLGTDSFLITSASTKALFGDGDLVHVAISFDGATNTTLSVTINGGTTVSAASSMTVATPNVATTVMTLIDGGSFLGFRFFDTAMTEAEHRELFRQARMVVPGYIFDPCGLAIAYVAGGGGE